MIQFDVRERELPRRYAHFLSKPVTTGWYDAKQSMNENEKKRRDVYC